MLKQTIIWTALPHASSGPVAAGTKLRLSVFVSPRLWLADETGDRVLDDYPDFRDWPAKIGAATFAVSFDSATPLPAKIVTPQPIRPDVWAALFNGDTRVVPYRFDTMKDAEVVSPPSLVIHDVIKGVFQKAGTDPDYGGGTDLPPRGVLAKDDDLKTIAWPTVPLPKAQQIPDDPTPLKGKPWVPEQPPDPDDGKTPVPKKPGCGCGCLALLRRLLKWIGLIALLPVTMGGFGGSRARFGPEKSPDDDGGGGGAPPSSPASPSPKADAFKQLYRALAPTSEFSKKIPTPVQLAETYDFHQMVSTLGDYPNLLRYCGLVIDLEVTLDDTPVAATGTVEIAIPSIAVDPLTIHHRPRTHYELGPDRFLAQPEPANGDLRNGLLRVDDEDRFRVLQLDVAGGGIKLQTMATSIVSQEEQDSWAANEPDEQGLPALQTAGLSIVRPGFGEHLRERFLAAEAMNNALADADNSEKGDPTIPPRGELFAEDLVRGYRVDVWDDKSTKWHSLCRRVGTYAFDGLTLPNEEDEGFVQASAVEPVAESETRVLRAHESLFTWNGWSLGAPRYGNTILPDAGPVTKIGTPPNEAATQFHLSASFIPKPKSLPRLRFGYEYKLRMRAADLAGNSVFGPDDAPFALTQPEVTQQVRYRRFEPVSPPMVMLQREPVEGESLERLVVRSSVADNAATLALQQTARHVVPPKTSQMMAEQHRKFDAVGAIPHDATAYALALREAGSLTERVKADGTNETIPGVKHLVMPKHEYWLQEGDSFELSYLPDPYARGVLLTGLPGMLPADAIVDNVNRITFNGAWPHPEPFRLLVQAIAAGAAAAAPVWAPASRLLTVQLPQGETYEVRISSFLNEPDLDNMAVWQWIAETGVANLDDLRSRATKGINWLHLPFRTLVLVHAVQQPLAIPALGIVTTSRDAGDTMADLHGSCTIDAKSTEKIDILAAWSDPIDDLSKPIFTLVPHEAHIDQVLADDPTNNVLSLETLQHAVGDTKYHAMTYRATASTRFREYFPDTIWKDPKNITRPLPSEIGTPAAQLAEQTGVDVLNTARPDAPKLLYIVPLFTWSRTATSAVRKGGGLRVYLDRPWFSSGDGELLGITIDATKNETLKKYASEWGMDPLWPAAVTQPLLMSDFADPAATLSNAPLAEIEGAVVDVVGYKPSFDEDRKLWYCDVTLKTGAAYFPMLRLALVRFQPKSVDGVHISPVVLANFIQTVPRREVTYDTSQLAVNGTVHVDVEGPAYVRDPNTLLPVPQMILRLERPSTLGATGELGWEPFASMIMKPTLMTPQKVVWSDDINAGTTPPAKIRIVVMEVEGYLTDQSSNVDKLHILDGGAILPGLNMHKDDAPPTGYRVTFADALEVP
jgi:hypothetical protein